MNLTSPSQVKDWCIRNGFHPNRVLGQNFLIDRNALDAILDAALPPTLSPPHPSTLNPNNQTIKQSNNQTIVLEIGPGLGVLTEGLLARGCAVTAIEKDPVLADRLKVSLGGPERLTVLKGDALDYIKKGACDGFPLMVSNLPYQAGTRILIELVDRIGHGTLGSNTPPPHPLTPQLKHSNTQKLKHSNTPPPSRPRSDGCSGADGGGGAAGGEGGLEDAWSGRGKGAA